MRIYYGEGNIWFSEDNIKGFDMTVRGKYLLESYNPDSFLMSEGSGRIIGVGFDGSVGVEPFLKYQGDLVIVKCTFVSGDDITKLSSAVPYRESEDKFGGLYQSNFDSIGEKFENLSRGGAYGEYKGETKAQWITKNLHTNGGQYLLNGENYIGEYHLHKDFTAMTGADHTDDSETLKTSAIKLNKKERIKKLLNKESIGITRSNKSSPGASGSGTSRSGGGY